MKLNYFFILVTFFGSQTVMAQISNSSPILSTELGFYNLEHQKTPDAVKKTFKSVFDARVIYETSLDEVRGLDLTDPSLKDFEQKVNSLEILDSREKIVVKSQVERCRRENIEKKCPVLFTIQKATAFLAGGDGSYLLTNAHVVDGYLKLMSMISKDKTPVLDLLKSQPRVLIYLFDSRGNLVFDPYLNQANVVKYEEPSLLSKFLLNWYAEDSDYVVLKLEKVIGVPIEIAKSYNPGEPVYHTGFAGCTGCVKAPNKTDPELNRDRSPYPNSNGLDYFWTSGQIQNLNTAKAFINADWYLSLARTEDMVFYNADSQVGMSGGPILNQFGEVVGIFAGAKPKINGDGSMSVLSRGVRPKPFNQ